MGTYSEYLDKNMDLNTITSERKKMLSKISQLRKDRDIVAIASNVMSGTNAFIDYSDILPFQDQLSNLQKKEIDIILESPGGFVEIVEDLVHLIRKQYSKVGIIVLGTAKSAATIFTMAGDEILMGNMSSLGPIDVQLESNSKRVSADSFLEGLDKIKKEITSDKTLDSVYNPILRNISPGEIQQCKNVQNFSKFLVKNWIVEYQYKNWNNHASTNHPVSMQEKQAKAEEIAQKLCKQSEWFLHNRSIKANELLNMGLFITDYSKNEQLNDAITRYYTLLRMTFETTNIYKLYETCKTHIYRHKITPHFPTPTPHSKKNDEIAIIDFQCPNCKHKSRIQANLNQNSPLQEGLLPYPIKHNNFVCPNCSSINNISVIKTQIEKKTGKKIV